MANKISVIVDVTVDRANRALADFKTQVNDADGAVGKFKAGAASAFASIKANALPVAAAAGAAMFKLGKDSVEAASDLEQAVGAIEKSFGDASDEVLAFAEGAADSVGLSTRAYAEAAVRLGSFAKQIANDTGKPVAEVLNDLIVRSSDLAATFGVDVSEAIGKVASGLAGESEPLRAWGIDMRKTAIQAHAAATGMDDMGEATQAAGLLFQSSSDYAGQFADESETLAGQQQRLGAELENMLAALGEQLIPVITDATASIRDLMGVTGQANQATGGLAGKFVDLAKANYNYLNPVGQARTALDFLTGSSDEATESLDNQSGSLVQASIDAALLDQKTANATAALKAEAEASEDAARAAEELAESVRDAAAAYDEKREATLAAVDSSLGYRNQLADTTEAIHTANTATEDIAQAMRDAEAAAYDQAAAAVQLASDTKEAEGSTLSAMEANEIYRAELQKLSGTMSGEAKAAVDALIAQLRRAPGEMAGSTFDIGEALSEGIADGVEGSAYKIAAALKAAVEAGKISAKLAARIASPSKLFAEEVGEPISAGIAEGIETDAHKLGEALGKAIDDAQEDAIEAAQDLVDDIQGVIDTLWDGIDGSRAFVDMLQSVEDAQTKLDEVMADPESTAKEKADATERLEDANYKLAKSQMDALQGTKEEVDWWFKTAEAAGLTKDQIDALAQAYRDLNAARAEGNASISAAFDEGAEANRIRTDFAQFVSEGLISKSQLNHLSKLGPGAQVSTMQTYMEAIVAKFPKFHGGGVVPGLPGTEVPILAQAGERVLTPAQSGGMDPAMARDIAQLMAREYAKTLRHEMRAS